MLGRGTRAEDLGELNVGIGNGSEDGKTTFVVGLDGSPDMGKVPFVTLSVGSGMDPVTG